jgi:hypothetical protein
LAVLVLLVVVLQARVDIASVRMLGNDSRVRGVCVQKKTKVRGGLAIRMCARLCVCAWRLYILWQRKCTDTQYGEWMWQIKTK